jgi:peroxiredoxin
MPDFSLPDTGTSQTVTSADFAGKKGLLVMFICKHCPFVVHVQEALAKIGRDYRETDLAVVAISANDVETHPDDSPENLAAMASSLGFTFPLLYDESQEVAKAFKAACTPDFFLFDEKQELVYRGQMDDARPGNTAPNDGRDLRNAMDSLLAGTPISPDQKPSLGCNIKWKPESEPDYF